LEHFILHAEQELDYFNVVPLWTQ